MTALSYLVKMRGTSHRNMGLSVSQWNSSYSRVLTKQSEYSIRLEIQISQRFEQLEIELKNILSDCENQRNTSNRPICFPTEPSVTKIHVLTSGSRQLCSRFPLVLLEKPLRVCIHSIMLNRKGDDELFYCVVDRRKAFSLISSRDHCQRSSPSRISDTPRA